VILDSDLHVDPHVELDGDVEVDPVVDVDLDRVLRSSTRVLRTSP